jgi:hypothetical protein
MPSVKGLVASILNTVALDNCEFATVNKVLLAVGFTNFPIAGATAPSPETKLPSANQKVSPTDKFLTLTGSPAGAVNPAVLIPSL